MLRIGFMVQINHVEKVGLKIMLITYDIRLSVSLAPTLAPSRSVLDITNKPSPPPPLVNPMSAGVACQPPPSNMHHINNMSSQFCLSWRAGQINPMRLGAVG